MQLKSDVVYSHFHAPSYRCESRVWGFDRLSAAFSNLSLQLAAMLMRDLNMSVRLLDADDRVSLSPCLSMPRKGQSCIRND